MAGGSTLVMQDWYKILYPKCHYPEGRSGLNTMRLSSSVNATEEGDVSGWSCLLPLKIEKGMQCPLSYLCCLTLCISGYFCDKQLTRIDLSPLVSQLRQSYPILP